MSEDEIIKRGPGRPRTMNTAEAVSQTQDAKATANPTAVPVQNGTSSLDEDGQRYMNEKAVADFDVEAMFQQYLTTATQGILPDIPKDQNYGYCWVTTNKTFPDNNIKRKLQGWHECTWEDVQHLGLAPGNINTTRSADISEDLVSVQEMILMRIPLALRNRIMQLHHHDAPKEKEENVYAAARDFIVAQSGGKKGVMLENESDSLGSLALQKHRKANFQGV